MLSDFTVPGTNEYASMIDGAKRDRAIWSGDMNVEIPSIAYSTDDTAYAKGALELLGSYQLTSGFVTGDLPPQDNLSPSRPSGSTGSYSADYSIYWLLGLADYYLYSGDTAFVTQELPVVKDQLARDASQVNSTGPLVTTSSDDADWDFYDPGKTGEVTERRRPRPCGPVATPYRPRSRRLRSTQNSLPSGSARVTQPAPSALR